MTLSRYGRQRSPEQEIGNLQSLVQRLESEIAAIRMDLQRRANQRGPMEGRGTEEPVAPTGGGGATVYVGLLDGTLTRNSFATVSRYDQGVSTVFGTDSGTNDTVWDQGLIIPTGVTLNANCKITYYKATDGTGSNFLLLSYDPENVST